MRTHWGPTDSRHWIPPVRGYSLPNRCLPYILVFYHNSLACPADGTQLGKLSQPCTTCPRSVNDRALPTCERWGGVPMLSEESPTRPESELTDRHVSWLFAAELAIYEADLAWQSELADGDVQEALRWLTDQLLSSHTLPRPTFEGIGGHGELALRQKMRPWQLIASRLIANWEATSAGSPLPPNDDLAVVLREIGVSVQAWTRGPGSRGYLAHVREFLRRGGIHVELLDEAGAPMSTRGVSLDDRPLDEVSEWLLHHPEDDEAFQVFARRAIQRTTEGRGAEVIALGRALADRTQDRFVRSRMLWLVGWSFLEEGQVDRALEALTEATTIDPDFLGAWRVQAEAHIAAGRADQAVADLERALELHPEDEQSYELLAHVHRERGDETSERAVLERRADALPRSLVAQYELASFLERCDSQEEAGRAWHRLRTLSPAPDASFLDWAIWTRVQVQSGRTKRAYKRLERVWQRDSEAHWWAPWLLAVLLEASGDSTRAKEAIERIRHIPGDWRLVAEQGRSILAELLPAQSDLNHWLGPSDP
jgi:tetratricopeptide (TPR) repeat protein